LSAKTQETCEHEWMKVRNGCKSILHLGPRAFWKPGNGTDGRWKEMTDTTNQAGYRGVWATFQGIQIDTKLAAIQKLQVLGISSKQKWWSDMEFLAHRLKSGRIEHTTTIVRVLPNEPL